MLGKSFRTLGRGEGGFRPVWRSRDHGHYRLSDIRGLDPWKKRMVLLWSVGFLVAGVALLICACSSLRASADAERADTWDPGSSETREQVALADSQAETAGATRVLVGTYVENIETVDIRDSLFSVTVLVWFRWDGDPDLNMAGNFIVDRGLIQDSVLLGDEHSGTANYQLVRINVDVSQVFATNRFPLDSHEIGIVVQSKLPATRVVFDSDAANSSVNSDIQVSGYRIDESASGVASKEAATTESDPSVSSRPVMSEFVTAVDLASDGFGVYFKCFIAMYGTTLWVLIMLWVCGSYHVDPLDMMPDALFGTVANIMIGAELVPDALSLGLLEFVNIWGVLTIIATTLVIIQVDNIRSDYGRRSDEMLAELFCHVMFFVVAPLAVVGNIVIPLAAYLP